MSAQHTSGGGRREWLRRGVATGLVAVLVVSVTAAAVAGTGDRSVLGVESSVPVPSGGGGPLAPPAAPSVEGVADAQSARGGAGSQPPAATGVVATRNLNEPPEARFTHTPEIPLVGQTVVFDARGSSDDGGAEQLRYRWSFGGGYTSTSPVVRVRYERADDYDVTLTVTDAEGLSDTETEILLVNELPTAAFRVDPEVPDRGEPVTFDASGSTDDRELERYEWRLGDGTVESGKRVTHTYDTAGQFSVSLSVTDNMGGTDTQTRRVRVNAPPEARFEYQPVVPVVGDTIRFDATASEDDRRIVAYEWSFGDGTTSTGVSPTYRYTEGGTFEVVLTVVDDDGAEATMRREIALDGSPVASFEYAPERPTTETAVRFDASGSVDDGRIVAYEWTFDDGTTKTGVTQTHTFTEGGEHTVTLTVRDNSGLTGNVERTVSVETANARPVADFSYETDATNASVVTFDASESSDPDGSVHEYQWTFGDGSPPVSTDSRTVTHAFPEEETYTVTLVVVDGVGAASEPLTREVEVGAGVRSGGVTPFSTPVLLVVVGTGAVLLVALARRPIADALSLSGGVAPGQTGADVDASTAGTTGTSSASSGLVIADGRVEDDGTYLVVKNGTDHPLSLSGAIRYGEHERFPFPAGADVELGPGEEQTLKLEGDVSVTPGSAWVYEPEDGEAVDLDWVDERDGTGADADG